MSDTFDPGPEWREIDREESLRAKAPTLSLDGMCERRYWVREVPVPALPTAPYTVIRVTWRSDNDPMVFTLYEDDRWHDDAGGKYRADHISGYSGFVVLSEPRAVTAKALIERVVETAILVRRDQIEPIREEFGVTDA